MKIPNIFIWLSILAGMAMAFVSVLGIISPETYAKETLNWSSQAIGQDYVNLFLVFPLLIGSSMLLVKNSLKSFFIWLGLLIYMIYSYILYSFFIHFGLLFLFYIAVLGLSFYSFAGSLISLKWGNIGIYLRNVKVKAISILLGIIGLMFYFLWLADIITALITGGLPQDLDKIGLLVNPVQVLDLALLLPGAIVISILLWKRNDIGLILAVPMLVFFSVMGTAIIAMMIVLSKNGFFLAIPQLVTMGIIIIISIIFIFSYLKIIRPYAKY